MANIKIDLNNTKGFIKPMNAVNNGPTDPGVRASYSNFDTYKAARIPYARNHDASFFTGYGGEHTVDVHRIFRNFDADVNDPDSYIFEPTDKYLETTIAAGTKVFYRLGAAIEHGYKYGTQVPKDYLKWAQICEHIIRHYTEGWANGFNYDIEYWEIWNEFDCRQPDGTDPNWQGTDQEFFDFYCTVAKYLKEKFPHLKIGGPALANIWGYATDSFFQAIKEQNAPLDFFSYHWYGCKLEPFAETLNRTQEVLEKYGFGDSEKILNEWNYIKGWSGDAWNYSLETEKNLKGASFITGAMCIGQALPLDMLMYYDARPCGMNGMFAHSTYEPLKGYYPIAVFSDLTDLGSYVDCGFVEDDIYYTAATNGTDSAILLTYFDDDEKESEKLVSLDIKGIAENTTAEIYILDGNKNLELVSKQYLTAKDYTLYLNATLFSTVLIKIYPTK